MKKLGIVLGVAAVATITGCKDPDYVGRGSREPQNEVKSVPTSEATTPAKVDAQKPTEKVEEAVCKCPVGTKHAEPCGCGAADCQCVVEKPLPPPPPAEPEYTIYVVRSGDYLAKISKRYNITIAAIRELNPSLRNSDMIRVGQKLKLPGKVEVGEQPAPTAAKAAAPRKTAAYKPYTGATKEYVVKSGDTLGAIAYGNGINVRQLKELNGLSSDMVRVGQKLKIPAEKVQAKASAAKPVADKPAKPVAAKAAAPAEVKAEPAAEDKKADAPAETAVQPTEAAEAPAAPGAATTTYVVQEGDDVTGISIAFGVSSAAIRELNNLGDNDQVKPGQVIKLPAEAQQ